MPAVHQFLKQARVVGAEPTHHSCWVAADLGVLQHRRMLVVLRFYQALQTQHIGSTGQADDPGGAVR